MQRSVPSVAVPAELEIAPFFYAAFFSPAIAWGTFFSVGSTHGYQNPQLRS